MKVPHKPGLQPVSPYLLVDGVAHSMNDDCECCLEGGMDALVTKPIRASQLFEAIESTFTAPVQ